MHTLTLSLISTREQKVAEAFHLKKESHFSAAEILGTDSGGKKKYYSGF